MSAAYRDEPTAPWSQPPAETARSLASRSLRRLTRFVASALDVRFAFVVADDPTQPGNHVAFWLARDYGLRAELAELVLPEGMGAETISDLPRALRVIWPDEPGLAGVPGGCEVSVRLLDAQRKVFGYLGILDPQACLRFNARERLQTLVQVATAELERWGRCACS